MGLTGRGPRGRRRREPRWHSRRLAGRRGREYFHFGRAGDERPDFVGEGGRIASRHWFRRLLATESSEQTALWRFVFAVLRRGRQLRDVVALHMFRVGQRAQVRNDLSLITRREQGGEQDDVGYAGVHGGNRGVARVDDDEFRVHAIANHAFEDRGLAQIGLQGKNERGVVRQGRDSRRMR